MSPSGLWRHFWLAPVDAAPLRAVRVGYAVLILWYLVGARWLLGVYFGPGRFLETTGLFNKISSLAVSVVAPDDTLGTVTAIYAATAVAALFLATGVLALPAAAACFALVATWVNLAQLSGAATAGDLALRAAGLPLLLAAVSGYLTRTGPIPAWPLRLLQIQVVLIYLAQAVARLQSSDWRNGTALCQMAADSELARVGTACLCGPAGTALTWAVPGVEILLGVLLWIPPLRGYLLLLAVVFHGALAAAFRVPLANEAMLVLLLAFSRASWLGRGRAPGRAPAPLPTTESAR